jgi:hypothetical protein
MLIVDERGMKYCSFRAVIIAFLSQKKVCICPEPEASISDLVPALTAVVGAL